MRRIEREDIGNIIQRVDVEQILGKTFLVTGATGALARYCVMVLLELAEQNEGNPCKVIILCRNMEKACGIWGDYLENPNFKIIKGCVEESIQIYEDVDYIIHAACTSATKFFYTNPVDIASANTIGTYHLLNLAREKTVDGFLFVSSGAVYGGATDDDKSYVGLEPLDYKNCYNMSKRMGENFCAGFVKQYGVPAKIIRIGYTYGPHIDLKDGHLYSSFINSIIKNEDLIIKGDGQDYIAMTYVTDAVVAIFKVLLEGNVAIPYVMRNANEYMTIEKLAEMLTNQVFPERNLKYKCEYVNAGRKTKPIIREPIYLKELGWEITVGMAEGFRRAVTCLEERR